MIFNLVLIGVMSKLGVGDSIFDTSLQEKGVCVYNS